MSKYLKRKIHKRANAKQILSAKDKQDQEQLIKTPIEVVMEDIEREIYCKDKLKEGIKRKNFALAKQSLELCCAFSWYECKGSGGKCPLLNNRIESFKDIAEHKMLCKLFR